MSYWVILGSGYIGTHLAKSLLADGQQVLACARNKSKLEVLEALGADTYQFEATRRNAFHYAMGNARSPIVVYSLPPYPGLPGGELLSRATSESLAVGASRFVYLSSTAVYGEGQDGVTVDEDSPTSPELDDADARPYVSAEGAVEDARVKGLDAIILRLSPVYGSGRGVRPKIESGKYKLLDDGRHVYSRIHVADVVNIIRTAVERAPTNATYCLGDDRPCPQREYAEWLSRHLNVRMPTSVPTLASGMPRRRIRNRAVSNGKLKRELDYVFLHPTYREGELAIDRALGKEAVDEGPPPLVIHRADAMADFAKNTKLMHLGVRVFDVPTETSIRIEARGDIALYVLDGSIVADNSGDKVELKAGDLVEIPSAGLGLQGKGKPARVFEIRGRR